MGKKTLRRLKKNSQKGRKKTRIMVKKESQEELVSLSKAARVKETAKNIQNTLMVLPPVPIRRYKFTLVYPDRFQKMLPNYFSHNISLICLLHFCS